MPITKKQIDMVKMWESLALVVGYNELAKTAPTLGEKAFLRMARESALGVYREFGGKLELTGETVALTLDEVRPHIVFYEKDIELMRETVAKWDEEHKK